MYLRREEDRLPPAGADLGLAELAAAYLRETLRDFAPLGFPPPRAEPAAVGGAGATDARRREWRRRWRRLRLGEQVAGFAGELAEARSSDAVLDALATHAPRIVGAHVCLLFLPAPGGGPLRARREPRLEGSAEGLELDGAGAAGVLAPADAVRFPALAPLFAGAGAASLACAPFAGGAAVLVERRADRVYDEEDLELLRLLAGQAEAALERVRGLERVLARRLPAAREGEEGAGRAEAVLRLAESLARRGCAVAVAVVAVAGAAGPPEGDELHGAAEALRAAAGEDGVALHLGAGEFLLVMPGKSEAEAFASMAEVRAHVPAALSVRAAVAGRADGPCSLEELVARAAGAALA
ncbi:MAG TPA: GAF domain-containing protein [Longimicrobium sp.]|jgi:hypothetical protein